MKKTIDELFSFIENRDIDNFRNLLSPANVNTKRVIEQRIVHNTPEQRDHIENRTEHKTLLHEAIRHNFIDAVTLILSLGGDILQKEKTYSENSVETSCFNGFDVTNSELESESALVLIGRLGNLELIQIAFDHLCRQKLYAVGEYHDFLYAHLHHVNCAGLSAQFLLFDVGSPLPTGFNTPEQLIAFLIQHQIDIKGIFFTKANYLSHLQTHPNITLDFLEHAITRCQFSAAEFQSFYNNLSDVTRRRVIRSHPEIDATLAATIATERAAQAERDSVSAAALAQQKAAEAADRERRAEEQALAHLFSRRTLLKKSIKELESKKTLTKNEKTQLKNSKNGLETCKKNMRSHPLYKRDEDDEERPSKKQLFSTQPALIK
ncbi:MAG: hypothetical protein M3R00_08055 [Pseudomonadota bacterium]|nr:hypothetical protein [Pseudomonadota bacterium]